MSAPNDVKAIFLAAVEKGSSVERNAYLDSACADNIPLRQRVEALLRAHDNPDSSLENPAAFVDPDFFGLTVAMPPVTEVPGTRIGHFKLLQQIGEGGFGVVFLAEQEEPMRRRVALKIIKPGMDSRQVIVRFEAERQALAMMEHQNIARVLDAGTTNAGRPYFVMDLVKGVPITDYCDNNKRTPRERLELFIPVCQAIQHAHQKGIIHRDIKPSNVLVCLYDGKPVPKVIDFGIAKAIEHRLTEKTMFTQYGQVMGTLEYMSPEQAELSQLDIDTRSDIYSLGVLLYELLTGTTPITKQQLREAGFAEMLRIIREKEPEKPSIRLSHSHDILPTLSAQRRTEASKLGALLRGELDWIVMKALEKDRTRRYDTASAFAFDIQRYLDDEPVHACPPSGGYRLRKFVRKHRMAIAVASTFAVVVLAAAAVSTWQWREAEAARGIAVSKADAESTARQNAEIAKQAELQQRHIAELQAAIADAATRRGQRHLYVAHMNLVGKAMDSGNVQVAKNLLSRYEPGTGVEQLREFEWFYWKTLCDMVRLESTIPTWVSMMATSPDGHNVAVSKISQGVSSLEVWNLQTAERKELAGRAGLLTFSHDSRRLAVATFELPQIIVWNLETNAKAIEMIPASPATCVAFSPDDRLVAAAAGKDIAFFNVESGERRRKLSGGITAVSSFAFEPSGRRIVAGRQDGSCDVWDLKSEKEAVTVKAHKDIVTSITFIPRSDSFLTGSRDGSVVTWDTTTLTRLRTFSVDRAELLSVSSDAQTLLIGASGGLLRAIDLRSGEEFMRIVVDDTFLFGLAFLPSGTKFVTGGSSLKTWRIERKDVRSVFEETASSMAIAPNGDTLVCGNSLRFLSTGTSAKLKTPDGVISVVFSPRGDRLATGSNRGQITIWDAVTGDRIASLDGHKLRCFSFPGQSKCLFPDLRIGLELERGEVAQR